LRNLGRDGVEDDQERGQAEQEDRAKSGTDETGPVAPDGHYRYLSIRPSWPIRSRHLAAY
jgi:hypothetical protein